MIPYILMMSLYFAYDLVLMYLYVVMRYINSPSALEPLHPYRR